MFNSIYIDCNNAIAAMKDSRHRVLFQNADNTINMGLCFNNKNIEDYDLFWFSILATVMNNAMARNEGLVCVDKELKIKSCYAELHRKAFKNSSLSFQSNSIDSNDY